MAYLVVLGARSRHGSVNDEATDSYSRSGVGHCLSLRVLPAAKRSGGSRRGHRFAPAALDSEQRDVAQTSEAVHFRLGQGRLDRLSFRGRGRGCRDHAAGHCRRRRFRCQLGRVRAGAWRSARLRDNLPHLGARARCFRARTLLNRVARAWAGARHGLIWRRRCVVGRERSAALLGNRRCL